MALFQKRLLLAELRQGLHSILLLRTSGYIVAELLRSICSAESARHFELHSFLLLIIHFSLQFYVQLSACQCLIKNYLYLYRNIGSVAVTVRGAPPGESYINNSWHKSTPELVKFPLILKWPWLFSSSVQLITEPVYACQVSYISNAAFSSDRQTSSW